MKDRRVYEEILSELEKTCGGGWPSHCRAVAACAERIAAKAGMDSDKAYIMGLMHDIGRGLNKQHLAHVYFGYKLMLERKLAIAARACLTHSFVTGGLDDYIGEHNLTDAEIAEIETALARVEFDDYDRLIQLCDALAGTEITDIIERMADVKRRYGFFPQSKWDANLRLKKYFEEKTGENIYRTVTDNSSLWDK